ncbi:transposase domain protein [Vibrio parahaemolyticus 3259]|nr:transposase domain protein [Vibrio parahaemolyticus 3259]ETJ94343.1 transposase domain protein [Vibrio parahaemolyticus EKP-008]
MSTLWYFQTKWAKRLSSMESLVWKARADALIHLHIPNSMMSKEH